MMTARHDGPYPHKLSKFSISIWSFLTIINSGNAYFLLTSDLRSAWGWFNLGLAVMDIVMLWLTRNKGGAPA